MVSKGKTTLRKPAYNQFSSEIKCTPFPEKWLSTYISLPFLVSFLLPNEIQPLWVFRQCNILGTVEGDIGVFYKWDSVCPSTSGHLLMLYYEPSLVQQTPPSG